MKVFKFGGASVKDAAGILNLFKIVSSEKENLVVVVSAFGKTTNALEKVLKSWIDGDDSYTGFLNDVHHEHQLVTNILFDRTSEIKDKIETSFKRLEHYLSTTIKGTYDFEYDQIVSNGEIWSTIIVEGYLKYAGLSTEWIDIRGFLKTDDRFRDANVLWSETSDRIRKKIFLWGKRGYLLRRVLSEEHFLV